jgi:hypothetical protein
MFLCPKSSIYEINEMPLSKTKNGMTNPHLLEDKLENLYQLKNQSSFFLTSN